MDRNVSGHFGPGSEMSLDTSDPGPKCPVLFQASYNFGTTFGPHYMYDCTSEKAHIVQNGRPRRTTRPMCSIPKYNTPVRPIAVNVLQESILRPRARKKLGF